MGRSRRTCPLSSDFCRVQFKRTITARSYAQRGLCCRAVSDRLSVRPSVCLSVTLVYCVETTEFIIKQLTPVSYTHLTLPTIYSV